MQNKDTFLNNQLLIATPALDQGVFKSSVTYICQHDEDGAMGVIINRPSDLKIDELLTDDYSADSLLATQPVMVGGPIDLERGFILHQNLADDQRWRSTLQVSEHIALTSSKDILAALDSGSGPRQFMFVLGYAGWAPKWHSTEQSGALLHIGRLVPRGSGPFWGFVCWQSQPERRPK